MEADELRRGCARVDNEATQQGFYVGRKSDGMFSVVHRIHRPELAEEIAMTTGRVLLHMSADAYAGNLKCEPDVKRGCALVEPIYARSGCG